MPMKHPKKEVQEALEEICADGWWALETGRSHWGVLKCGHHEPGGCQVWVNGTPQNPGNHANKPRRLAASCPHRAVNRAVGEETAE